MSIVDLGDETVSQGKLAAAPTGIYLTLNTIKLYIHCKCARRKKMIDHNYNAEIYQKRSATRHKRA